MKWNQPIAPRRSWSLALAAMLMVGCSGGGEFDFPVVVAVNATDGGAGVSGATLSLNGEEIGKSGEDGTFKGSFHGSAGSEVILEVAPPKDFKLGEDGGQYKVTLGTVEGDDGPKPQTLSFQVRLVPTTLEYVVLVTSPGKYRPIYVNDKLVGRTGPTGAAAVPLRGKPGRSAKIRVDTRSRKLAPLEKSYDLDKDERILQLSAKDVVRESNEEKEKRIQKAEKVARTSRGTTKRPVPQEADEADAPEPVSARGRAADEPPPPPPSGEVSKEDKAAAKKAAKEAKAAAKKAKAAVKKAKASAKSVAKIMKKFPSAREIEDANTSAERVAEEANRADQAASAAATAASAHDLSEAERQRDEAQRSLAAAEEEAARTKELIQTAKTNLAAERERLEEELRRAKEQLGQDRERWANDIGEAIKNAKDAAKEAKALASAAAKKAKKVKKAKKKAAKAAVKAAKAASKKAAKLLKPMSKLAKKAKKANVGEGEALVQQAKDGQAAVEEQMNIVMAEMAKVDEALREETAPPPAAAADKPGAKKPGCTSDADCGKNKSCVKGKCKKKKKKKAPAAQEEKFDCTMDVVDEKLEEGDLPGGLLRACDKLRPGTPNYNEIHLKLASYYFKKKKYKSQRKSLEKATQMGQYKYDPGVLLSLIKVSIKTRAYNKAIAVKDRFLQVKDRLPPAVRKKKISEMYSLFAQAYEQQFYKKHNDDPDGDHLPLLEKAIDMWERYKAYSGQSGRAQKSIDGLKKVREELAQ